MEFQKTTTQKGKSQTISAFKRKKINGSVGGLVQLELM